MAGTDCRCCEILGHFASCSTAVCTPVSVGKWLCGCKEEQFWSEGDKNGGPFCPSSFRRAKDWQVHPCVRTVAPSDVQQSSHLSTSAQVAQCWEQELLFE